MEQLSVEDVIGYQIRLILASDLPEDQGTEGQMINPGNLDFTIDFCNDISEPFERAAYLLYHITTGHPFVSGNKRMAFLLAALVLYRTPEHYQIAGLAEENDRVIRSIAEGLMTQEEIEIWLRSIAQKDW
ncbi:Fic family protein [Methanosphaerula palustris]|uniref:Death-on-curing family protein n=1 Tax=Methanosphaerula palustris (strain ATCC BAA-1556 / DSM 19958 / E1-9c) TaxID=521011 RepID=B8GHV4_METPE|nr:Fic family protein [Methanosphaerula palustris]ACL16694.1 death-on-curing family protein [Methanosphaerula palustris E1-9c]